MQVIGSEASRLATDLIRGVSRSEASLHSTIQQYVAPGTTVMSDK